MKYIFMDEKGPQNSFKISKPFDKVKKKSYGDFEVGAEILINSTKEWLFFV